MRIALAADELTGVAEAIPDEIRRRGHEPILHGAFVSGERPDWAWASEAAARDVSAGRADQAIVACWTGTGASIAANKVPGIRAALCGDAGTAQGARRWNDANVLALSLRLTSPAQLEEILGLVRRAVQYRVGRRGERRSPQRDRAGSGAVVSLQAVLRREGSPAGGAKGPIRARRGPA